MGETDCGVHLHTSNKQVTKQPVLSAEERPPMLEKFDEEALAQDQEEMELSHREGRSLI